MDERKVLIIEDEEQMARYLELELTHEGYQTETAHDGVIGCELLENKRYDLALLDLMLPGMSGLEVLQRVRQTSDIPIIIATCKGEITDKVMGLDSGADDYITKPFAIEELLARMRVALKKHDTKERTAESDVLYMKPLTVDLPQRLVKLNDQLIDLTKTEFDLLLFLMQNKNKVLSRKQIVSAVWGFDYEGHTNIVDVYIRYLRTKIDEKFGTHIICTIRGVGYYAKEQE